MPSGIYTVSQQFQARHKTGLWPGTPSVDIVLGTPLQTNTLFLLNADSSDTVLKARIQGNDSLNYTLVPGYGSTPTGFSSTLYKWSGGSCRFDSGQGVYWDYSSGGYASTIGTGDFTMECWARSDTVLRERTYIAIGSLANSSGISLCTDNSRSLFIHSGGYYITSGLSGDVIVANTWQHICAMRKSGVIYTYVNGILYQSAAFTNNITETKITIGTDISGSHNQSNFNGNDWRITKSALYATAGFSVPIAKLTT